MMKSSGHCFPTGGKARNSRVPVFKFSSHTSQQLYTHARRAVHGKCIYLVLHYYYFFFFYRLYYSTFFPRVLCHVLYPQRTWVNSTYRALIFSYFYLRSPSHSRLFMILKYLHLFA